MPHDVQIKQFELSDQEAVLAFLCVAYANEPRKFDPDFWRWHYLENPYTSLDDVPLWIVKDADRVVGQAATILVELKVAEETRRAVWILDFILLPEYRGQKLGKRLMTLARETYPTMFALGINDQSRKVFSSLDWAALGSIHRYQRLLYPGHALKEIANVSPLREIANLSYAAFRPRSDQAVASDRYTEREVANFDSSFDELWQRASPQWPCAVIRSSRFLQWQFRQQPGKEFEVLGLYDNERLAGYVVLFFRKSEEQGGAPPKAAISDICYDGANEDIVDELLQAALRRAVARRAGSLVIDVLDARVEARLLQLGFKRIKASPEFTVYSPIGQELLYDPAKWFLSRADSDVSIFEEPNR
jgi:GNAT superfamily N-acetyltransferase